MNQTARKTSTTIININSHAKHHWLQIRVWWKLKRGVCESLRQSRIAAHAQNFSAAASYSDWLTFYCGHKTDVYMQEIPESVQAAINAINAELRVKPEDVQAD